MFAGNNNYNDITNSSSNMIKICACGFLIFLAIAILHAESDDKSQNDGHCNKWGITFEQGQKVTVPQQCKEATCVDARTNEISLQSCKQFKIRSECELTNVNFELPYPNCCPKPVCPPGLE